MAGRIFGRLVLLAVVCFPQLQAWDYECSFDGERHAHEIACNRYYECRLNGVGSWTIYLYKCSEGYRYTEWYNTCTPGYCGDEGTSTSTSTPGETSSGWEPSWPPTTPAPSTPEPTEEPSTPEPTQEPSTTPEPTQEPSTPEPTQEPSTTPEPTEEPSTTPEPTQEPSTKPEPTEVPSTPEPTQEPSTTPEPTEEPSTTPEPTQEPSTSPEPTEEPSTPEPEPTRPSTTEEPRSTAAPFECVESGYFTDTLDCTKFHHCVCNANGCTDNEKECPVGYHFCEEFSSCGTSSFCACSTDYRQFYY